MKLETVNFLEWNKFIQKLESYLKRQYNGDGIWNCPDKPAFIIDLEQLRETCGYMHGESKFICRFCLDPLCDKTWKDIELPEDPEKFLAEFGKSGYKHNYPNSKQLITITAAEGLEYLVRKGELKRGEELWLYCNW